MESQDTQRREGARLLRRLHLRIAVLAACVVVIAAVAASLAYAKTRTSKPIGTGVVVINTNLAYEGGQAAGTGMVLTSSGEVLTNNHVIRGATTITIVIPGTGRSYSAKVVGYDVTDDVAVLQTTGASHLKTVVLGNSATAKLGQAVKAVGNAGGTGSLSSVTGAITGITKAITVSDDQGGSERLAGLIETNADLQAGDSGGPLLNAAGKVVGMDTAASVSGYGFQQIAASDGYAIPINKAIAIAKQIESGKASATIHVGTTAFLGVEVTSNGYDGSGALVAAVVPGSPAAVAGLVPGDVITTFAGRAISTPSGLTAVVMAEKPGTRAAVTYADQNGQSTTTTLTVGSGPPQ